MIRVIRAIQFSFLVGALAAGAGCATMSGGRSGGHDLHATTRVNGDAARVLVSGPALLLHVDVDGRDDLALYAVARKDGSEADCAAAPSGERRRLQAGVSNLVHLTVAANQTVCVAALPSTRSGSVMWHARRIDGGPLVGPGQALAFDEAAR